MEAIQWGQTTWKRNRKYLCWKNISQLLVWFGSETYHLNWKPMKMQKYTNQVLLDHIVSSVIRHCMSNNKYLTELDLHTI